LVTGAEAGVGTGKGFSANGTYFEVVFAVVLFAVVFVVLFVGPAAEFPTNCDAELSALVLG